jgi:NTE family protein
MALAVGYTAEGLKTALDNFDFARIADYGPLGVLEIPFNVEARHGVTHGKVLSEWIDQLLADAPQKVETFGQLPAGKLRVVGVDLAHTRMVVFPDDVGLYIDEHDQPLRPEDFSIAEAVRISAGFPYFFPPRTLRDAQTKKPGVLVDGGVASPFPIFLFDQPNPDHPTWGFRLFAGNPPETASYTKISGLLWPLDMLRAIVDTSTNALDKFEAKEYQPRTVALPTGNIGTLDFALTPQQKQELYDYGYSAGKAFFAGNPNGVNTYGQVPAQLSQKASGGGPTSPSQPSGGGPTS